MHRVWHQVPPENLTFLLFRHPMENLPQLTACPPESRFPPPFNINTT
jgi:hypothetical protein